MNFLPFPKISTEFSDANPSNSKGWVAQEKIHGAQLVVAVGPEGIKFGKRKGWLDLKDTFFGWQIIRAELQALCTQIYENLSLPSESIAYFYGELFGGQYPHQRILPVEGTQAVQTGVWYSPSIHWAVFDAVILPNSKEEPYFLGADVLTEATQRAKGISPPVLGRGRINELMQIPVRFRSKLPSILGLPEIQNNWAEGYVIKPNYAVPISRRSVVKLKIEEFDEKRFDESEAWNADKLLSFEGIKNLAAKMVNPARISSARSKVGNVNTDELTEEILLDVLIDLEAAFPKTFQSLDEEQELILKNSICSLIKNFTVNS